MGRMINLRCHRPAALKLDGTARARSSQIVFLTLRERLSVMNGWLASNADEGLLIL